ncbi:hypothetical protein HOV35_gp43 [Escherichia phage Sortsne]|uniref:Uncharacterized protein n=1 Tax=Escherichia phage Sortsne TaxID=2562456 RepID=A0A4D6DZA3_9CAUD|nr:hypothetical protein HOV35_gp43 [Escherichia phage Sortsne]QBZ71608.1 hypothetical protein [Escherichia phage Sortsne]
MNEAKAMRAIMLAQAEEMGIEALVKQHEARLAGRFIQQPTEQDLAAYGMAIAIVAMQVEALMTNAEPQVKAGEVAPAPIEVELQPTAEQIEAGRKALWEQIPGALDGLYEQMEEEGVDELLSDTVVFTWQAMIGARNK